MNCSEAKSLFSARVDFELTGPESLEHDRHLSKCSQCDREWRSYQITVRMVRSLPVEMASASFVGQVLDKVRAYEAQPVPSYLDPADRPAERLAIPTARAPRWTERLRGMVGSLKSPVPAFAMVSLALGILVGVVAMDWQDRKGDLRAGQIERIAPVPDPSLRGVDGDHSVNPFADLADEIRELPSLERGDSYPYAVLPPATQIWPADPGLQQQVRAGDVRPRITF